MFMPKKCKNVKGCPSRPAPIKTVATSKYPETTPEQNRESEFTDNVPSVPQPLPTGELAADVDGERAPKEGDEGRKAKARR